MKHTPGPYTAVIWDDNTSAQKTVQIFDKEQRKIADVCHIYDGRTEEWENIEATATVLAAAPDLLDAAQRTLSWLHEFVGPDMFAEILGESHGNVPVAAIRDLLAACTKAARRTMPKGETWDTARKDQYTPEVRAKMRQAKVGKKPKNIKQIQCIETGQVFQGITKTARALNINRQSVYLQLKGKLGKVGGKYTFKYF